MRYPDRGSGPRRPPDRRISRCSCRPSRRSARAKPTTSGILEVVTGPSSRTLNNVCTRTWACTRWANTATDGPLTHQYAVSVSRVGCDVARPGGGQGAIRPMALWCCRWRVVEKRGERSSLRIRSRTVSRRSSTSLTSPACSVSARRRCVSGRLAGRCRRRFGAERRLLGRAKVWSHGCGIAAGLKGRFQ